MKPILIIGALFGFFGVILGAFGAHLLKDAIGERMNIYDTASRYHFYHVFAIFISSFLYLQYPKKGFLVSAILFAIGILFFSGSLYILSISGFRILGAITPIGGSFFLAGWVTLGYTIYEKE